MLLIGVHSRPRTRFSEKSWRVRPASCLPACCRILCTRSSALSGRHRVHHMNAASTWASDVAAANATCPASPRLSCRRRNSAAQRVWLWCTTGRRSGIVTQRMSEGTGSRRASHQVSCEQVRLRIRRGPSHCR